MCFIKRVSLISLSYHEFNKMNIKYTALNSLTQQANMANKLAQKSFRYPFVSSLLCLFKLIVIDLKKWVEMAKQNNCCGYGWATNRMKWYVWWGKKMAIKSRTFANGLLKFFEIRYQEKTNIRWLIMVEIQIGCKLIIQ